MKEALRPQTQSWCYLIPLHTAMASASAYWEGTRLQGALARPWGAPGHRVSQFDPHSSLQTWLPPLKGPLCCRTMVWPCPHRGRGSPGHHSFTMSFIPKLQTSARQVLEKTSFYVGFIQRDGQRFKKWFPGRSAREVSETVGGCPVTTKGLCAGEGFRVVKEKIKEKIFPPIWD